MTTTPPLLTSGDPDLDGWQSSDPDTYLAMASREVRKYCGWHISPSVTETNVRRWFGERELVMLKSTHVTALSSVTVDGQLLVADTDYWWDEPEGWLRRKPAFSHDKFAVVTFDHGHTTVPEDVKAVVFEVMATAMELPASNADRVQTMQYSFELRKDTGIALSPEQKVRLGHYKITKFGA